MKLKKRLAVLLTAAMVMTMTVPAMAMEAGNYDVPGGGHSSGTGTKEGHVELELGNVVLPVTISTNAFDYTVDPERLVKKTDAARFVENNWDVSQGAQDKGVFFLVSENKYDYQTPEFEFENRSSFPIDLTVQLKASHNVEATDLKLMSQNGLSSATEAGLYLGLKVGNDGGYEDTLAVDYDAPAKVTVSVDGIEGNFQVSWNSVEQKYEYKEKETTSTWKKGKFQVEGEATEDLQITDNTSAPTLEVTWSWVQRASLDESKAIAASISKAGDTYYISKDGSNGFDYEVADAKLDDTTFTSFTVDNGWIMVSTSDVVAGKTIYFLIGGKTYKVTTP